MLNKARNIIRFVIMTLMLLFVSVQLVKTTWSLYEMSETELCETDTETEEDLEKDDDDLNKYFIDSRNSWFSQERYYVLVLNSFFLWSDPILEVPERPPLT